MSTIDEDSKQYIENDEELRYSRMLENGRYSEIPTRWLEIFLERAESNERAREAYVQRAGLEGQRPVKSEILTSRIKEIKEALEKRE